MSVHVLCTLCVFTLLYAKQTMKPKASPHRRQRKLAGTHRRVNHVASEFESGGDTSPERKWETPIRRKAPEKI